MVNENCLSASGEESEPVELMSRDIVQFGVNVNVEKKSKCIIGGVKAIVALVNINLCTILSMVWRV